MEWLTLVVWITIAAIAMPLSAGAIFGRLSLGLQAFAGIAGLALLIVICIEGLLSAVAWAAVGAAGLGAVATAVAASGLISEHPAPIAGVEALEEQQAGLAGAQLALFLVAAALTVMVALNIGLA